MPRDELRDKAVELRVRERELVAQLETLTIELTHNRAEQERVKAMLLTDAKTAMRLQSVTSPRTARAILAQLSEFTEQEACTELGWKPAQFRKLRDLMACEKPPALVDGGRALGHKMYRYEGPAIEIDPEAERLAVELETVRAWAVTQTTAFTPGQAAAATSVARSSARNALTQLEAMGVLVNEGPTPDMPMFSVAGVKAPDVVAASQDTAALTRCSSKIPAIQALLDAAYDAGADVTESDEHFAIEVADRGRVVTSKKMIRGEFMQDKARLRRMGLKV